MSQISELQRTLGVPQSEKWDTPTQAAVTAYQAAAGLAPTGLPTPAVLARLGIFNPLDLAGTTRSRFTVSLLSAMNQVPWYLYLGVGVAGLGVAAMKLRRSQKNQ